MSRGYTPRHAQTAGDLSFAVQFNDETLLLKAYNLFYSNGVAIFSGFHDILQYQACRGE